jgi:hypothetical protein
MADVTTTTESSAASFLKSKFDNICLLVVIIFLICLLTWVDKHGNGDYEKWLEVFIAGFGGAYLGLITASRQAWQKTTTTNGNGTTNGTTAKNPNDPHP